MGEETSSKHVKDNRMSTISVGHNDESTEEVRVVSPKKKHKTRGSVAKLRQQLQQVKIDKSLEYGFML